MIVRIDLATEPSPALRRTPVCGRHRRQLAGGGWPGRLVSRLGAQLGVPIVLLLALLAYASPVQAQLAQSADQRASMVRLRALLGPFKTELPAIKAEQARLWKLRPTWQAEPFAFIVWRRLALNFRALERSDSLLYCMRQAQAGAAKLGDAYPLEVSNVLAPMGNVQWARQAYDSAAIYYRASMLLLARAGPDTLRRRLVPLLEDSMLVGPRLAQDAANTGLALRRTGDLVVPLGYYERALRLFEYHAHTEGVLWVLSLLGEAYEEQGDDIRALATYTRALAIVRRFAATDPRKGFTVLAELSTYTHRLLLRRGQAAVVRTMVHVGDSLLPVVLALPAGRTHPWEPYAAAATLAVRDAEAELDAGTGAPAVQAALTQADTYLTALYRVTADHAFLRLALRYYELRAEYSSLLAVAGIGREKAGALAVAYADSVATPAARHQIKPIVAQQLLRAGQPLRALTLLRASATAAHTHTDRLALRTVTELLATTYAALGRYDSAYAATRRAQALTNFIRTAQHYAALTAVETRYQTTQKESQIERLTERSRQETRQTRWALFALLLLAVLLVGVAWVLNRTRALNRELFGQRRQLTAQAEQLAVLDRAKNDFFANVSHELRTPLTLITGPAEVLLEQPAAALPEPARAQIALMLRNGQRLQKLIDSILDLSKLEAGRMEVHPAPVVLATLMSRIGESFRPLADRQGLGFSWRVQLPHTLPVLLDAGKLEQVINNLVGNALKFNPSGGRVWVYLTALPTTDGTPPSEYHLTVSDTGPGIAPAEQARVFDRFYQSRSQQAQGGTGIGLALSRELAVLLGGTLTLMSRVGEGSTFTLTFRAELHNPVSNSNSNSIPEVTTPHPDDLTPVEDAPEAWPAAIEPPTGHQVKRGRPRILLVEDHADLRHYLRDLLAPNYDVLEAAHGLAALHILAHEPVDLISSDAMMPEMGGMELLRQVKAHPQWAGVPFLMLTARADDGHRLDALALGVDDYLPKPFRPRELLARVEALISNYFERRRWLDPRTSPAAVLPDEELLTTTLLETVTEGGAASATEPTTSEVATLPPTTAATEQLRRWQTLAEASTPDPAYTVAELARQLGLSERSLHRHLKELTGLSPAAWLRETRLNQARRLFEGGTSASVAEVAYAVGFNDPGYFGQVYYKRFGKRPSEYRMD